MTKPGSICSPSYGSAACGASRRLIPCCHAGECEVTGIVGIYSDPRHVILYTSDGEVRQELSIVLTARALGGQPTPSSESSEVRWVSAPELPRYAMDRSMRIHISDFLEPGKSPIVA